MVDVEGLGGIYGLFYLLVLYCVQLLCIFVLGCEVGSGHGICFGSLGCILGDNKVV